MNSASELVTLPAICDPLAIPTGGTCTPFAGNRIPADRIDPIAAGLLEHVPLGYEHGMLTYLRASFVLNGAHDPAQALVLTAEGLACRARRW